MQDKKSVPLKKMKGRHRLKASDKSNLLIQLPWIDVDDDDKDC